MTPEAFAALLRIAHDAPRLAAATPETIEEVLGSHVVLIRAAQEALRAPIVADLALAPEVTMPRAVAEDLRAAAYRALAWYADLLSSGVPQGQRGD